MKKILITILMTLTSHPTPNHPHQPPIPASDYAKNKTELDGITSYAARWQYYGKNYNTDTQCAPVPSNYPKIGSSGLLNNGKPNISEIDSGMELTTDPNIKRS